MVGNEKYLAKRGVKLLYKRGSNKAPYAERYVGIIKIKLRKYMRHENENIYFDKAITTICNTYNNTINAGMGNKYKILFIIAFHFKSQK